MASTSARLGLIIPDDTDTFDNDQHLKGNLQKIDAAVAKASESVKGDAQQMEMIEVSFNCSGSANTVNTTITFAKNYSVTPTIMPGQVTQTVSYSDTMQYPFFSSMSKTGVNIRLQTSNTANNFSAGTLKMRFVVFGA